MLLFSRSVMSYSATPWAAARQASLSFSISWGLLKLMSIESVMPSSHLILCFPWSFAASGSFTMSQFFASGGQTIGTSVSASVLPMNIQDWFPLGLAGLISLLSKGLSKIFSSATVWRHQIFSAQPFFIVQLSHLFLTTRKTIALTIWTFVGKVISLLFNTLSRFLFWSCYIGTQVQTMIATLFCTLHFGP